MSPKLESFPKFWNFQTLKLLSFEMSTFIYYFQSQRGSSGVTGTGWVIHPLDPFLKFNETSGETTEVPFKPAAIGWAILFAFLCFILLFVESQVAELLISGKILFRKVATFYSAIRLTLLMAQWVVMSLKNHALSACRYLTTPLEAD